MAARDRTAVALDGVRGGGASPSAGVDELFPRRPRGIDRDHGVGVPAIALQRVGNAAHSADVDADRAAAGGGRFGAGNAGDGAGDDRDGAGDRAGFGDSEV